MQNILGYAHTPEATPIIHEAKTTLVLLRMTTDTPTKTKTIKQSRSTHCIIYIATSGMCVEVISRCVKILMTKTQCIHLRVFSKR